MESSQIERICRLPRAASLRELCDLAYQILGNPVFIGDMAHNVLAHTECVEIDDKTWQYNIVQNRLDRVTLTNERETGVVHTVSTGERRPVLVTDDYMSYPRMVKTLLYKSRAVGVIVATGYLRPFGEEDADLLELISSFVIRRMAEDQYFISENRQSVENYLIHLLDGARREPEQVRQRLDILGYKPQPYMYMLAIRPGDGAARSDMDLQQLMAAFRGPGRCRAFMRDGLLVCLWGGETDIVDWPRQEPELNRLLVREGLTAGVSRQVKGMERLAEYYRQAQAALDIGLGLNRSERVFRFDAITSFLLFRSASPEALSSFCHQKIQELSAYDESHGTELCATLQVYLEQSKSLSRTAELLFIHRNTVHYRIKKCMELMNTDLEDGNEIFSYNLSLRIREYQKKFPI